MAKSKNFSEPEEESTIIENDSYSPLDTPINEKPYTRANVKLSDADIINDIPEPKFQPPPIDLSSKPATEQPKKPPVEPMNSEMKDMPKKEQTKSAEHISKVIIDAYELLHVEANKTLLFNERKLRKLSADGEIDFNIPIRYDYKGNVIPAYEFINDYNEQQKDTLKVSPEFKAEALPVLTRVLQKRGVGFTEEQYLLYLFTKDISVKAMMYFSAKSQMKEIIELMKESTAQRGGGSTNFSAPNKDKPKREAEEEVKYNHQEEESAPRKYAQTEEIFEYPEAEMDITFEAPTVNEEVDAALQGISVQQLQQQKKKRGRKPKDKKVD